MSTPALTDFRKCIKIITLIIISLFSGETHAQVSKISGMVFQDYNANGIKDGGEPSVSGVTVNVYDATGSVTGTANSAADGFYAITSSFTGPFKVVFSNIPSGFFPGFSGPGNGTSLQFIAGNTGIANLGIYNPQNDYCKSDPDFAVPVYVNGDPLGGGTTGEEPALIYLPYHSGFNPVKTVLARQKEIGVVWGLAFQKESSKLVSAAFVKRHAGLGPLGIDGLYISDYKTQTTGNYFKLSNIDPAISAGTDPHAGLDKDMLVANYDSETYKWIGKTGLGGIDFSEDGSILYVVNVFEKKLYEFPVGIPASVPTKYNRYDIPSPTGADSRPFALKFYKGKIYVGVTCTNESIAPDTTGMKGIVYEMTPQAFGGGNNSFDELGFKKVLEIPFTYKKGESFTGTPFSSHWYPWKSDYFSTPFQNQIGADTVGTRLYPQPWLTDIEFDDHDNMLLGIKDRTADQIGNRNYIPDPTFTSSSLIRTQGVGDLLVAGPCGPDGTYILENNASVCGGPATGGKDNNQGPGGGEFYFQDDMLLHQETSLGGIAVLKGSNEVITNMVDPIYFWTNGVRMYDNTSGQGVGMIEILPSNKTVASFGKSASLGDIELLMQCGNPPIEIGNRIWIDSNNNGFQDPGESGLEGVTLDLYEGNTKVGTTISGIYGQYYFNDSNVPEGLKANTAYQIRITGSQTRLTSYALTKISDNSDILTDNDAVANNGSYIVNLVTGNKGENNHSFDIGFICDLKPAAGARSNAVCLNTSIELTSSGGDKYAWTGPDNFSSFEQNPVINNATNAKSGTYSVTVYALNASGSNLFSNSGFDSSNDDFSSDYTFTGDNNPETDLTVNGKFSIIKLPNNEFVPSGVKDHTTQTSSGYVLLANGATNGNSRVWYKTIPVKPNSRYRFAFSVLNTSISGTPPEIAASVNGQNVIPANNLTTYYQGTWIDFEYIWDSGINTTATFAINDPNGGDAGNDFALDDISIISYDACEKSASVLVNVITVPDGGPDLAVCSPSETAKLPNPTAGQTWNMVLNPSGSNPAITPDGQVSGMNIDGIYRFSLSQDGCTSSDTVQIIRRSAPAFNLAIFQGGCNGGNSLNNATISIVNAGNPADRYDIIEGSVYNGTKDFNTASSVPQDGIILQNITNPIGSVSYTVRIFTQNNCYSDKTITLQHVDCGCNALCLPFNVSKTLTAK